MDHRDSLDRSSSEAPGLGLVPPTVPNGTPLNGSNVPPASAQMPSSSYSMTTVKENSPVVDNVLQSDVCLT